jgi:hypothetical protein
LGYNPDNLLEGGFRLPAERYKAGRLRNQFRAELVRRVRALPGVVSATFSFPALASCWSTPIEIGGQPSSGTPRACLRFSEDRFFETIGIQLLQGRTFDEEDMVHARKVAVVNRAFVSRYFGGENPLGRQITGLRNEMMGSTISQTAWFEIVGVVADTRHNSDTEEAVQPIMFVPFTTAGESCSTRYSSCEPRESPRTWRMPFGGRLQSSTRNQRWTVPGRYGNGWI